MVMKRAVLCIGLAILTIHAFAQNEAQTLLDTHNFYRRGIARRH
jgi:hypothetical protein